MPFREYNCQQSTAVSRIAYNKHKNELIIEYYPNHSENIPGATYHYTRIRLPRDDIERALLGNISLGEYINTQIKPNSRYRQLQCFPSNIRPPRSSIPNYSSEWLTTLERRNLTREYLEELLQVLSRCDPKDPPAFPPPPMDGDRVNRHAETKQNERQTSSNPFAELDSEDEKDDIETESVPEQTRRGSTITMQSRYLFGRVICAIAESFREDAVHFQRDKDFPNSSLHWTHSYDQLLTFANSHVFIWASGFYQSVREDIHELDDFNINEYFSEPGAASIIFDMHNIRQLYEFLNAYEILLVDTERHKATSLQYLHRRAQIVREKLFPMLQDRDSARQRMGDERWTNNPHPKLDYAEKRREWEEELRNINEGIELLEQLNFLALKTSRQ